MDKNAQYQMAGQDLGFRFAVAHLAENLDKTASEDEVMGVVDAATGIEYTDQVVKTAHNMGFLSACALVVDQLEKGASADKLIAQLNGTIEEKTASAFFPQPESDEEAESFYTEMVKGAAVAISSVLGGSPSDDEILEAAQSLVDESIEQAQ